MATRLTDLDEFFSPGLVLTVRGREYTVPLASAELGVWCRRMASATGEIHAASTDAEVEAAIARVNAVPELPGDLTLPERTLGDVYQQMVDDGVPDAYIQYCGATAYIWIVSDEETARRWWQSGGRPEALRPTNRAERRAAGRTSTGEGATTHTRASTSGTTSRKKSPASGKASTSPGRRS